jgi:hypothetical protein
MSPLSSLDRKWLPIIGGVVGLGAILILVIGGIFIGGQLFGGDSPTPTALSALATDVPANETQQVNPSFTPQEVVVIQATDTPPPPTPIPTLTATPMPTETPPPTATPTETVPAGPYVSINEIFIEGDRYVVVYETFGYTEQLPGMHVHFYFDTVSEENAGAPGSGPWFLYGGPRPFKEYTVNSRPSGAMQMCARVANPDHSILFGSGNCFILPENS